MDATQHGGWGGLGHVNVPCNLHALWMLRNTVVGVGGHVNVPCNLHALLMLRNTVVGVGWGMLTFHVTCMRCGCYATRGCGCGGSQDLTSHRDNSRLNVRLGLHVPVERKTALAESSWLSCEERISLQ